MLLILMTGSKSTHKNSALNHNTAHSIQYHHLQGINKFPRIALKAGEVSLIFPAAHRPFTAHCEADPQPPGLLTVSRTSPPSPRCAVDRWKRGPIGYPRCRIDFNWFLLGYGCREDKIACCCHFKTSWKLEFNCEGELWHTPGCRLDFNWFSLDYDECREDILATCLLYILTLCVLGLDCEGEFLCPRMQEGCQLCFLWSLLHLVVSFFPCESARLLLRHPCVM